MVNDKSFHTEIGSRIRHLRQNAGVSQIEIAEVLGVTFQQVQKYEKGTNRLNGHSIKLLKEFFDVPYEYFFEENGSSQHCSLEIINLSKKLKSISKSDITFLVNLTELIVSKNEK